MLVISTREFTQHQHQFFEMLSQQRVIIKRKNRFFQLVDLGATIPELDDSFISKEEMYAKIDRGIEEYRQGKTKTFSSKEENHHFLNSL